MSGGSFAYSLPAMSVVTFVGQAIANTAPALTPVDDQIIDAGVVFAITNQATDVEAPPQTLTFTSLSQDSVRH